MIIRVGSHAYLYTGHPKGFKDAVDRVKKEKHSAGSTVRYKLVVK
jgi:hypothetical protein